MKQVLLVGVGGFLGSIARYKLGGIVLHYSAAERFPLSTFAVNVLGCLIAGLLAGCVQHYGMFSADTRLFLFTGLLGGFTTFSAFGLESVLLIRRGELSVAASYIALSVVVGMFAFWLGLVAVARRIES